MTVKGCILIVEDNADHLELFTDAFLPDYEVISAANGEECLEAVSGRSCDLVILDYYLSSEFSGLDVLREITNLKPDLPVIMVTAYGNEELAVKAMKSGAKDYISKTLDNSYIDNIHKQVEEILSHKRIQQLGDVKRQVLNYLQENRGRFIESWRREVEKYCERADLPDSQIVDAGDMDHLFSAFIADIQNDRPTETILFLKKMVFLQDAEDKTLLAAEILNLSFKEVARMMLRELYPEAPDNRTTLMTHIGNVVDSNDLELSKEYENLIRQSTQRVRQSERLATKALMLTTLQHEIRQPLSFILNTAELLLDSPDLVTEETLKELLKQTRRIEKQLDNLERDSQMETIKYSEDLSTITIRESAE